MSLTTMDIYALGSEETLIRPCVDCGQYTGSFCDNECLAKDCVTDEEWEDGQLTPHCTSCEDRYDVCHFCRDVAWVRPPAWR
jgi:hypothetical protein